MRNFWLVARHEYRRVVMRRAFVLLTLAIPLGMALLIAIAILVETSRENRLPLGYVDHSGLLDASRAADLSSPEDRLEIRAYSDETAARAALENNEIQAFFVLPADYAATQQTDVYTLTDPPGRDVWRDFSDFVRLNLVTGYPQQVQQRLLEGAAVTVEDVASGRRFSENAGLNLVLPFIATFFFFIATLFASGYMLQVVADEKENRTMEIMLTSMRPVELIGGKAMGLLAAALTQLGIYIGAGIAGLLLAAPHVPALQAFTVPWGYLGIMALFFLPAYVLIAAMMVAIGGAVTELQQGQQIAGLLNLLFVLPVMLTPLLFQNPNHPVMQAFTLFPTTSFLTISLRWGVGTVPLWQIGLSWAILVTTAVFMVWAAARIFRAGMLRYGQPLTWRSAVASLRG